MIELLERKNQVNRRAEAWRPPRFRPIKNRSDAFAAAARRFVDLQAGSIWRDLSRILPQQRGVIVDVGCGAQPYRTLLHQGAVYQGIDYSGAARGFGYRLADTTYYEGDRWPISDAAADAVLCTETLEHVPEPSTFLAEAFRCLKPGGSMLITVPFSARWHFIPHDYWRFTPSGLERLLRAAGFANVAIFARGNSLTVACYKAIALLLPFFMPQEKRLAVRLLSQCAALVTVPILFLLAIAGNLSLSGGGGDDCLGYTAIAARPAGLEHKEHKQHSYDD